MTSTLERKGTDFTATLLVDNGAGYSEQTAIAIPATRKGKIKHVFKLPPDVRGLRWSPMRSEGVIVHALLVITEIGQFERIIRMAGWVAWDLWKFRKTRQASQHGLSLAGLAFDLQGSYDASSKLRVNYASPSYASFVHNHDTLRESDKALIQAHVVDFARKPLISVILSPSSATARDWVRAIDSVRNQLYPYWELWIPADDSLSTGTRLVLERYQQLDARIRLIVSDKKADLCSARNSALASAAGDYIALMDDGDELAEQALYHVALEINLHPDADLIYSDEDKVDESGKRYGPYFKCDWNPDLFYSSNYISHVSVYKKNIIIRSGGFRAGYGGNQYYDTALRVTRQIPGSHIRHIPFILCHRAVAEDSRTMAAQMMDESTEAGVRALQDCFKDEPGVIVHKGPLPDTYRVQYPLPVNPPLVSMLIPTRDSYEVLHKCVESILSKTDYHNWEIIILNNQTRELRALQYLGDIAQDPRIRVLNYDRSFNYSAIMNFGARAARGEILVLLNNDVEVMHGEWLAEMVSHAIRPEIGAVGAKLLFSDGYVQHAGVVVGLGGLAGHVHRLFPGNHQGYAGRAVLQQNFSAVTAACLAVRRQLFEKVGGLNERKLPVAYNDVDLCLRIKDAGFRNVWTPYAKLYHHESYSRGDDHVTAEKRSRFNAEKKYMLRRWKTDKEPDPYYSPNLTIDKEDLSIAHYPRVAKPWKHT